MRLLIMFPGDQESRGYSFSISTSVALIARFVITTLGIIASNVLCILNNTSLKLRNFTFLNPVELSFFLSNLFKSAKFNIDLL